jgi:protein-S-isoprenylcysteine O-methyltransferase Ste14
MAKKFVLGVAYTTVFVALHGAILFGCAGRWDLPMFWALLGVWAVAVLVAMLVIDPGLIRERSRPGPGGKDYATLILVSLLWLGQFVVAGLDVGRYHWSDGVPIAVQVIALVATAAGAAVLVWAEAVNRFFSSVIRIQTERGHHVITTGPYRYLRHPGYAASPFLLIGGGLVLGSWLAALIGVIMSLAILRRTGPEDRLLHEQLEGYADYARKVRYRLIPGVW